MTTRNSIKKIDTEIHRLQRKRDALRMKQRRPIIKSIVRSMREYNISPEELSDAFRKGRTPAESAVRARARASATPKYRNEATGETWSGRGRAPRWIAAAEAEGVGRERFLIQQSASEHSSSNR
jgi:DNA-binding protein H-NS